MTLKPIPGAPIGAPIPDFPTGKPGPQVLPRPVDASPSSPVTPMRQPGPIEFRGGGNSILTFRCFPEIPAINRSSMTISVTEEPAGESRMPRLDLATDTARAFLLALRDGESPVVVDNGSFQVVFVIEDDGPSFTVSSQDQERALRRFSLGRSFDVKMMAAHLLADLGP
jgi:hypothetical protein